MTDMLSMVLDFPKLLTMTEIDSGVQKECGRVGERGINGIMLVGMGGSAIAGFFVQAFLRGSVELPIVVNNDYGLPEYVDSQWAIIAVSYSGNTEETLAAYQKAVNRDCPTFVLASGGKLLELEDIDRRVSLPSGYQPRAAFPGIFSSVLNLVESMCGLEMSDLNPIAESLSEKAKNWESSPLSPKVLAEDLNGIVPIFIGSGHLTPVAYRTKCQVNENAKMMAFHSVIPEANHNEIEGFVSDHSLDFVPVFLRSSYESESIAKRMEVTTSIYEESGYSPIRLSMGSSNALEEILAMTFYLDWVSAELANLRGVDPVSVERISKLKEQLK
jgi:glucose/mannose-6-phosphate isomerase